MALTMEKLSDLDQSVVREIGTELQELLADVFALYMKTKNFHWHMSGRHFRDYHLLLDEQADQLFAITDEIAERARSWVRPRCDPSVTFQGIRGCRTITANSFQPRKCSKNSGLIIAN